MYALCTAVGVLCLAYYLAIIAYAGITADFAWIWLAAGIVLLTGRYLIRYEKLHPGFIPGWVKASVITLLAVGGIIFIAVCSQVIMGMVQKPAPGLDYVVVLGAQVKKDTPSRALRMRLDKAYEYARQNPETILILSGGQGSGEDISEAQCMSRYLMDKGIDQERLILEENSTSTKENLEFSNKLTGCGEAHTGILSNNFHVYRAIGLAKKQGYAYVSGIPAPTDPGMQVHFVVREFFALIKEKIRGNI